MIKPAPPLPALTTILSGLSFAGVDIGQKMRHIGGLHVDRAAHAGPRRRGEFPALREAANVLEAVVAADRFRLFAHEFHAVVVRWIVACGDHDAAVVAAVERRKIHALRAAHPDVVDVDAAVGETAAHGIGEFRARQTDVAADDNPPRREKLRVTARHPVSHIVIQFTGNPAA